MIRRFALLLLIPMISGAAVPAIAYVLNSASYRLPGLSASGIAQGSIFTVFGSDLGPSSCGTALALPLETSLCGVTLTVTVNTTSTAPIPLFVYSSQINAILPSLTPTGSGTLTVTYGNQTSESVPIQVVAAAFGTFTPSSYGYGQASVTYNSDGSLNTIIHTLHPGDIAVLWGTGLGPIAGSDANTPPVANIGSPTMHVGNAALTLGSGLIYAGRSNQFPGLDQIDFTVPPGVQGCYVPIAVDAGGGVANIGTIAVSAAGTNTCSDSVIGQDLINQLASGQNASFAYLQLQSINITISGLTLAGTFGNGDYAYATFSEFTPATAFWAEYGVSSGYCASAPADLDDLSIAQLDAGAALSLTGPLVAPPIPDYAPGFGRYGAFLANSGKFLFSDESYSMAGTGGANVKAFSVTETSSLPSAKLVGLSGQTFPRTSDLQVQWNGGNTDLRNVPTIVAGASFNDDETLGIEFLCTAPAGATSFTIPAWVLSTLPATGMTTSGSLTVPNGYIWVGQYNTPTTFTAPGIDFGIMTDVFFQGNASTFQ